MKKIFNFVLNNKISVFLCPLAFFVLLSFIWFYPVVTNFSSAIAGQGGDPYQTLWRFVRLGETVKNGSMVIPEEFSFPNLSPLIWLPAHYVFGEVVAYNFAWISSVVLAGYLTYLFARVWGGRFFPSMFAGVFVMFCPYRISQSLGHFGAMQIWVILAFLIAISLWFKSGKDKHLYVAMLFFVLTAWTDHQMFVVILTIILFTILFLFKRIFQKIRSDLPKLLGVIFFTLFLSVIPFIVPLSRISTNDHLKQDSRDRNEYSATVRSVFFSNPFSLFNKINNSSVFHSDKIHYVGILLPIVVAILFIFSKKTKKDYLILVLIVLSFILAMGEVVSLRGYKIYLPTFFLYDLPVFSSIRTVGRFILIAVIFLPFFMAIRWGFKNKFFYYLLPLLFLFEVVPAPGFPIIKIENTKAKNISGVLLSGNVLPIPAYTNYEYGSKILYESLGYKHVVVGNSALGRIIDPDSLKLFLATPVIRDLVLLRLKDFSLPTIFGQDNSGIVQLAFAAQGIGNIIFETNPTGGVVSFEGNKSHVLSEEEIGKVRMYLRDDLRMKETKVSETEYIYQLEKGYNQDTYFAMEGDGWNIEKKTRETSVSKLDDYSIFYIFSTEPRKVVVRMKIMGKQKEGCFSVVAGFNEKIQAKCLKDELSFELNVPASNYFPVQLILDGEQIKVENPRIEFK